MKSFYNYSLKIIPWYLFTNCVTIAELRRSIFGRRNSSARTAPRSCSTHWSTSTRSSSCWRWITDYNLNLWYSLEGFLKFFYHEYVTFEHFLFSLLDPGHAQKAVVLAHHETLEEADAGAGGRQQEQADPAEVLPAQRQTALGQRRWVESSLTDLGFVTLGLGGSGCKFALFPPTMGKKTQICTLIHANLESQIPSLLINQKLMCQI